MNENIKFSKHDDYLLTSISDTVITLPLAHEILTRIGQECSSLNLKKVLLDERSVERREVLPHEIKKLSQSMTQHGLNKISMAFWCQPHLINKDSHLLKLFTFDKEYVVQHFSDKKEAVLWLNNRIPEFRGHHT